MALWCPNNSNTSKVKILDVIKLVTEINQTINLQLSEVYIIKRVLLFIDTLY